MVNSKIKVVVKIAVVAVFVMAVYNWFVFPQKGTYELYMGQYTTGYNYWLKAFILSPVVMIISSIALRKCEDATKTVVSLIVMTVACIAVPLVVLVVESPAAVMKFFDMISPSDGFIAAVVLWLPLLIVVAYAYFAVGCLLSNLRNK